MFGIRFSIVGNLNEQKNSIILLLTIILFEIIRQEKFLYFFELYKLFFFNVQA